ncbi:MAG: hypothetical protein EOS81_35100, partial [Mesorhizobium sp.]
QRQRMPHPCRSTHSIYGAIEGALASGFATAELHHLAGVRHAKLMIACGCKSHPAKAVAGKPGPSLAGVAATRGLKCRQEPCGVRE